jgi:diguanylate cyclase (GGDEF)-like protein/PAS domain S-box-containing protein
VPFDPLNRQSPRSRLSTLQVLGFAGANQAESSDLRALQHARLTQWAPIRSAVQLLAVVLAVILFAGSVPWLKLALWSVCALLAIGYAARLDGELARTRKRELSRRDICRHAQGTAACALAWSVPLLLHEHWGGAGHLALWTLTATISAYLALTTWATPLATVLFAGITGAAAITGFAMHGEWTFAVMSFAFAVVTLYGTVESARGHLVAQIAEAGLADKEKLVSLLLREFEEHEADWLWHIDTARRVRNVSRRFAFALNMEPEAAEGRPLLELMAGEAWESGTFAPSLRALAEQLKQCQSFSDLLVQVNAAGQERWWKLSGTPLSDDKGRFTGYRGVGSDVTAQRASEQRIAFLARHDALTSLPNRAMLNEALLDALRRVERAGGRCAFLLIDLDRFKAVNDSLGHPVGDKLLVQVAARLRSAAGRGAQCGRLGGDEFAVIVPDALAIDVDELAQRVIDRVSQPYEIDGHHLSIGTSVGSAEGPRDGDAAEALMRNADLALYRAKSGGRGAHQRYEPALRAHAEERRVMELALRHAIARQELHLAFQPIVEACGEQLAGFEALLRWENDQHGAVGPDRSIPLAETSRLIGPIGEWVLQEACRQAMRWPATLKVAVNLSGSQLLEPGFADKVQQALSVSGLAPQRLELELTESSLPDEVGAAAAALNELRRIGCGIALDDFGTGTSSLGQLRQLRFCAVKIDRSYVRGAARGAPEELAIVRAVIAMAESIGITTTAEGVETAEEATLMRRLGCGRLQGFHYGRPMTATEALAFACRRPPVAAGEQVSLAGLSGKVAAA